MNINPDLPPGRPGPGGNGGGCQPGEAAGPSSITVSPNLGSSEQVFVATGTQVQLSGSARVRRWLPDCSFVDHNCRSIQWGLLYQPVGGDTTNVTSILLNSPQSNPNSFVAGVPGRFQAVLGCPELVLQGSTVATKDIFVGTAWKLDGTATVWVQNTFAGTLNQPDVGVHAVLVTTPSSDQALVQVSPIIVSTIEVSQKSADGTFDSATGVLSLHLVADVSGQASGFQVKGTIDITLSTDGQITPPGSGPISGQRRGSDGSVTLVGDAPIVGPTGTTHGWLVVSGSLIAI